MTDPDASAEPEAPGLEAPEPEADEPLRLLFLDEDLVAVAKPPGLSVHRGPSSAADETFLLQRLAAQIDRYLYPVHRLDRGTSGVLTFALSKKMAASLQRSLQSAATRKDYLVLARGDAPDRLYTARPLSNDNRELQPARTEFETLARFFRCSLLRARLDTGRTHQIRRHLDHLAHQVIGDSTHGKGRINKMFRTKFGMPRLCLHAWRLRFAHPKSGALLDLTDPLPDDLADFFLRLPDVDAALVHRLAERTN